MIQIDAVKIKELRGIRELSILPGGKNFVVSGPNGSGKSGVVDAIQFGLTGEMSRLSGKGTSGVTVQRHGPHVDRRDDPGAAEVSLSLRIPSSGKTAVLTRNVKTAKTYSLQPEDASIRAAVEEVRRHPELTLSRREIIKYIIVNAGERSKEIQALLQLDDIGGIRGVLKTANNRLTADFTATKQAQESAADSFRRHLDIKKLVDDDILAAVNQRRATLGLPPLASFTATTVLNEGAAAAASGPVFDKQSALRDLQALSILIPQFALLAKADVDRVISDLTLLESDPALREAIVRRTFVERGLSLVDDANCPLCDSDWNDIDELKAHLRGKLAKSTEAESVQTRLLAAAARIAAEARRVKAIVEAATRIVKNEAQPDFAKKLTDWSQGLQTLVDTLTSVDRTMQQAERLKIGWVQPPLGLDADLASVIANVSAKPDQTATTAAQNFLTLAQDRHVTWRSAQREAARAEAAQEAGKAVYGVYCDVSEVVLTKLYAEVQTDFGEFYREINSDDEGAFRAELKPTEGALDLEVDFHARGMFPPAAYHSEGHQDGMGLCLYLALMKRLLGDEFSFALLDDVVMSVDQDHRKQVCKLLKTRFPNTQFLITTHDKIWAKQMQTEQLVTSKGGVVFYGWSVETGPIFEVQSEVWGQIDADLKRGDVPAAAARLRRHAEYIAGEVAERLGAVVPYKGDASYDLGDLLPAVKSRHGDLLGKAAASANSWNDAAAKAQVAALQAARTVALKRLEGEQWVVNRSVHFNELYSFGVAEFRDVVAAFKDLLSQFACANAGCGSLLRVVFAGRSPEAVKCDCGAVNLNLKSK